MDINELLRLAQKSKDLSKDKKRAANTSVLKFVEELKIINGTDRVPNYVLFYCYRVLWQPDTTGKSSKIDFFRTINPLFQTSRESQQRYYLLNRTSLNITPEIEQKALEYDKTYWQKKEKKI